MINQEPQITAASSCTATGSSGLESAARAIAIASTLSDLPNARALVRAPAISFSGTRRTRSRFRAVTGLYLETYERRVSENHATLRNKANQLARFWRFIAERYSEIESSREILPPHARAFIPAAIEQARADRRGNDGVQAGTVHAWLTTVRTFFTDLCAWATEPDSPSAEYAPRRLPLTHHDLTG